MGLFPFIIIQIHKKEEEKKSKRRLESDKSMNKLRRKKGFGTWIRKITAIDSCYYFMNNGLIERDFREKCFITVLFRFRIHKRIGGFQEFFSIKKDGLVLFVY